MYNEIEAKLQFSSISAKLQTLFASIMHRLPACDQSQEKPKTGLQTETRQLLKSLPLAYIICILPTL